MPKRNGRWKVGRVRGTFPELIVGGVGGRQPVARKSRDQLLDRARRLTGPSTVHMPAAVRDRVGAHLADAMEGLLAGDEMWARAAECLPMLILKGIPHGVTAVIEMEQRLACWEAQDYEGLVGRLEQQRRSTGEARDKRTDEEKQKGRGGRGAAYGHGGGLFQGGARPAWWD